MQRMLCVAAAALTLLLPGGSGEARMRVYARVKCVGLYCRIVPAAGPQQASPAGRPSRLGEVRP